MADNARSCRHFLARALAICDRIAARTLEDEMHDNTAREYVVLTALLINWEEFSATLSLTLVVMRK